MFASIPHCWRLTSRLIQAGMAPARSHCVVNTTRQPIFFFFCPIREDMQWDGRMRSQREAIHPTQYIRHIGHVQHLLPTTSPIPWKQQCISNSFPNSPAVPPQRSSAHPPLQPGDCVRKSSAVVHPRAHCPGRAGSETERSHRDTLSPAQHFWDA